MNRHSVRTDKMPHPNNISEDEWKRDIVKVVRGKKTLHANK